MRAADITAWWPCPPDDAEFALKALSRCPWLADWRYDAETQRVTWSLKDDDDIDAGCAHHKVKSHVQRSISEHAAVGWE